MTKPDKLIDKNGRIVDCWIKSETDTDFHVIMIAPHRRDEVDDNDHATHHVLLKSQFDRTGDHWSTNQRNRKLEELRKLIASLGLTADNLRTIADGMDNADLRNWTTTI